MQKKVHRSWVAGALFIALFFLWGGCFNTFGLFFMPLVKEFGATHASVSLLPTLMLVVSGLIGPTRRLAAASGLAPRYVMGVGAAVAGLALVGISYSGSFSVLVHLVLGAWNWNRRVNLVNGVDSGNQLV